MMMLVVSSPLINNVAIGFSLIKKGNSNTNYDRHESWEQYHLAMRANIEVHNLYEEGNTNVDINDDDDLIDVPSFKLLSTIEYWVHWHKIRTPCKDTFDCDHEM